MGFEVFRDSDQGAAFVICLVTLPICILATALRFLAGRRSGRQTGFENWFALAALAFYLAFTLVFLYLLVTMNGRSLQELAMLPPDELAHILKVGWGMSPQYTMNQLFAKMTLIFLYHRVFSVNDIFVRWLYGLGIAQVAWAIPTYVVKWNLCSPIAFTWDKTVPDGKCIEIGPFLAATEAFNSLIDFAMIGLAIWIVRTLRVSTASKWKLGILFSIGGLSGVIGFVKIGEAYYAAFNNIRSPIWDVIQMATSIICCCAPIYKPLILELGMVKALRSMLGFSLRGSGSRSYSESKPPTPPRWNGQGWTHWESLSQSGGSGSGHQSWLRAGGSSKEQLAWKAEGYEAPYDGRTRETSSHHHGDVLAYPMRTMEVRQKVEIV